jgi:hypothetical protein
MPRLSLPVLLALVAALILAGGSLAVHVAAQAATPAAWASETLVLVEHGDDISLIDQGEPGPSVGDLTVWGPNPLYDAENASDTGATTQGTCVALHAAGACLADETILFPDGSTLQFQGVELANGSSSRTIVGGSGRYLGATGAMTVAPTANQAFWTKTIEIAAPGDRS